MWFLVRKITDNYEMAKRLQHLDSSCLCLLRKCANTCLPNSLAFLFVVAIILSGCATKPFSESVVPSAKNLPPPILSQADIFEAITQNATALESLKGGGEIRFIDGTGKQEEKCRFLLLVKGRDKILMKGYQPLIPHFFTFTLIAENFAYYLPREDVVFRGKIAALDHTQNYDIALKPSVLLNAFLPIKFEAGKIVEVEKGENRSLLSEKQKYENEEILERRITFDHFLRAPVVVELINVRKTVTARLEFSNFSTTGNIKYPRKVFITLPETNEQIHLHLNQVLFNPELADSIFEIHPPESVREEIVQ